jgi:nucleoside-diphosphate-sugar epimerase
MTRGLAAIEIEPVYKPPRSGDIRESVADIDLAKKAFGFEPAYSFENGLEITFKWYKGNHFRSKK